MGSEHRELNIFFFPFMAHGHIIPTIDMAKLFASRGFNATIITTPLNASHISKTIGKAKTPAGSSINVQTIGFPREDAGLPEGCENIDAVPSPDMIPKFFKATVLLQEPLEQLLHQHHPHCLVADMFFPWATDSASKFGIPRLVFHGTSYFSLCASECMRLYEPYKNVSSDSEPFLIPNLPGEIKMTRIQVPDYMKDNEDTEFCRMFNSSKESELRSYGVVVNSFYELEQVYADHYSKVLGRRTWHIGPLSLCNRDGEEKAQRGKQATIDEHECLKWLDSKEPNSVVYVCFGSVSDLTESQLREIAIGLEASGQHFIWVVKRSKKDVEGEEEWLPQEFEKRMEGRGLIIRGWAPQVLILDHQAVGGFVTHCGWNSTLEGVSAGVPMVTWPVAAEQFYNEKLMTEVLKIGVPVGVRKWVGIMGDYVKWEAVEKAVNSIMRGEEAEEMRNRAKELGQMARRAVEKGGSSYSDLNALIQELSAHYY
ncbi:hypothetical protein L6164_032034 [Bauhinia variegata]|uniref:Uncharacterized protein n=2 Tax=Bauhinia variegata TaxID=167791 RepID=A0ACB9KMJ9_BAUVA|nr:hypothetical protein L6164_032034 [Bauhinia variegata]